MSDCKLTLGERIADSLLKQGKTQTDLCNEIGMKTSTLNAIITGERKNPRIETIVPIAKGLNTSLDYLLGLSDEPSLNVELKAISKEYGISVKAMENIKKMNVPMNEIIGYPFRGTPQETIQEYEKSVAERNKHRFIALNELLESKEVLNFFEILYDFFHYYKSIEDGAMVIPFSGDTEELICNLRVGDLFDNALPGGSYAIYDNDNIYDELLLKKVSDRLTAIKRRSNYTKNKLLDDKKRFEERMNTETHSILKKMYLDYIKEIDEQLKE